MELSQIKAAGTLNPNLLPRTSADWKKRHTALVSKFIAVCEHWSSGCKLRVELTCYQPTLEQAKTLCMTYELLDVNRWFASQGEALPHLEAHRLELRQISYQDVNDQVPVYVIAI